ncbi:hypothetical protein QF038_003058 [Pseudarthrobacter sp. W1I19]|uniref:hypothetical protein n=1 Tax=Pseudarthrobacter sp. W1I19 TaxID=3042288 RepID=UPI002787212B|nr:hypothetical protein [Pseudarthrobacter sp. W1I19]MDQ0924550.1 hypothetical protein [Pseudarthrobacter sp. W1I19]
MEFLNWLRGTLSGLAGILSAEKASWWGIPAVTAAATILGAIVAFTSTRASDNRKQKAEDARRYDEEIKDLGSKFLTYTDEYKKNSQDYNRLSKAATYRSVTDAKTGKSMKQSDIALRDQSVARHKAHKALNKLSFVAPESLHGVCRTLIVAAIRIDMLEKNDKTTNDEYRFRRRAVLNELRKTIKLEPLPHKAPLRARVKRRIKNPKSFWTDFQQIKAEP